MSPDPNLGNRTEGDSRTRQLHDFTLGWLPKAQKRKSPFTAPTTEVQDLQMMEAPSCGGTLRVLLAPLTPRVRVQSDTGSLVLQRGLKKC